VASFEVDERDCAFELPMGTLERASGPYRIEVSVERRGQAGGSPRLVPACRTEAFWTPPEPPAAVEGISVGREPTEHELCVSWSPPSDDGGSPVSEYQVRLIPQHAPVAVGRTRTSVSRSCLAVKVSVQVTPKNGCLHTFTGLAPGRLYEVEVRAMSAAGFLGAPASIPASTLVAAPSAPTALIAHVLPDDVGKAASAADDAPEDDVQTVRIEFSAPLEDGGRPLECYYIYATVERSTAVGVEDCELDIDVDALSTGRAGLRPRPLCMVPASEAAAPGPATPGCRCSCDVPASPNNTYTFAVVPFNGIRTGEAGDPAPSVCVPPRPPPAVRRPPEASRIEGGAAAELHWVSPTQAGGLPLTSFRIGILPMESRIVAHQQRFSPMDIQREVVISVSAAEEAARDCRGGTDWQQPAASGASEQVSFAARVGDLEADTCYRFVLAAINAAGTGLWSAPSRPAWTLTYLDVRQGECKVPRWIQECAKAPPNEQLRAGPRGQWIERGVREEEVAKIEPAFATSGVRGCSNIWADGGSNSVRPDFEPGPWTAAQVHRATALELGRGPAGLDLEALCNSAAAFAAATEAPASGAANENVGFGGRVRGGKRTGAAKARAPLRELDLNRGLAAARATPGGGAVQEKWPQTPSKDYGAAAVASVVTVQLDGSPARSQGLLSEGQDAENAGGYARCRCCQVMLNGC